MKRMVREGLLLHGVVLIFGQAVPGFHSSGSFAKHLSIAVIAAALLRSEPEW